MNLRALSCCIWNTTDDNIYGCCLTLLVFDHKTPSKSLGCFKNLQFISAFSVGGSYCSVGRGWLTRLTDQHFLREHLRVIEFLAINSPLPLAPPFFLVTNWWWQMSPARWRQPCLPSSKGESSGAFSECESWSVVGLPIVWFFYLFYFFFYIVVSVN